MKFVVALVILLITGASPGVRQLIEIGVKSHPIPTYARTKGRWGYTLIGALQLTAELRILVTSVLVVPMCTT